MANRKQKLSASEMAEKYARSKRKTDNDDVNLKEQSGEFVEGDKIKDLEKTQKENNMENKKEKEVKTISNEFDGGESEIYGERPIDRDYTIGNLGMGNVNIEEVPEPKDFEAPPIFDDHSFEGTPPISPDGKTPKQPTKIGTAPSRKPNDIPPPPQNEFRNTDLDGLTNRERNSAAEALADTILSIYVWLNDKGRDAVMFDEQKAQLQALEGKFDFDVLLMEIQMPDGSIGTIKDFLDSVNDGAKEVFTVTNDFKKQVKPLLVEILVKKGWGMSPEQRLGYLVAQDAVPKVMALFQIRKMVNHVLEISMETLKQIRGKNSTKTTYIPTAQPQQQAQSMGNKINEDRKEPEPAKEVKNDKEVIYEPPVINQSEKIKKEKEKKSKDVEKKKEEEIRESEEVKNIENEDVENE